MDVELILNKLESMNLVRLKKQVGNYMTCYCPFHNNGQERKPSCGVLLHEEYKGGNHYPAGWWHCFSCGAAYNMVEAIDELLKLHHVSQSGIEWLKSNIPEFSEDSEFEFLVPKELMSSLESQYSLEYIKSITGNQQTYISEEELASYRYTVPYMYERKLTDEIIAKFDVGFDPNFKANKSSKRVTPCITFPVKDIQGNTLFICRRSITNKFFSMPDDIIKPVYGIDQIPKGCTSVIVCESIINALTCWVYGYVAVALLGTGNTYQMQQLKALGVKELVLCFDGDEAGRKATNKFYNSLKHVALIWRIHMPDGQDVNSVSKSEFDKLYSERD